MLVLSNLSAVEQEVVLPLAEIQARNPAVREVADHMHSLPVRLDGGVVKCTVGPKNFRLLTFTR